MLGTPCDSNGVHLPAGTAPPQRANDAGWAPFETEQEFRLADFLYRKAEMSASNIDELLEIWALSMAQNDDLGPFQNYEQMYGAIDSISFGDAPWKCFSAGYQGEKAAEHPRWQDAKYDVWYRDPATVIKQLFDNTDFNGQFDYAPYVGLNKAGKRTWSDFMSGNSSWKHSVRRLLPLVLRHLLTMIQTQIYHDDPTTLHSTICPIILGSDKTTVSVMTGNVEYHPIYLSIGNVHNSIRRAHRNAVVPIGFLAIPKSTYFPA